MKNVTAGVAEAGLHRGRRYLTRLPPDYYATKTYTTS